MKELNEYEKGFISGFLDADGSLIVIKRKSEIKRGWTISTMVCFSNNDITILKYIQKLIGVKGTLITVQDKRSDKYKDQSRLTYNANIARELLPQLKLIHKEDKRLMMLDILNTKRKDNKFRYDYEKVIPKLKKWMNYKYNYGKETKFNPIDPTEFDIGFFRGFFMGDGHFQSTNGKYKYIAVTNNSIKLLCYLRDISYTKEITLGSNTINRKITTYRFTFYKNRIRPKILPLVKSLSI